MTLDRDLVAGALSAYEIGGELGRGGWGVVLEGRHIQLGREVAIKQLPRAFASDPDVRGRFIREARLLASLDHPHIVPVYDFVEREGLCLLVMEKLAGGTVWSRFATTGIAMDAACAVTLATCSALEYAHLKGVLHRDIKPENLLFADSGVIKVTDFGIAKVIGGSETLATRAGEVLGTPAYMAPEQAQAGELGPATDVYSLGVMLYELLSGRLPFSDEGDALALLFKHVYEQPIPLGEAAPQVPDAIAQPVMRSIATAPGDRYSSAGEFATALAEATTASWGPGWLGRAKLPVMGSGQVVAITERQSGVDRSEPAVAAPKDSGPAPVTEAESLPLARSSTNRSTLIRPTTAVRTRGLQLDQLQSLDLVPLREVAKRPSPPTLHVLAALGLLLAAAALAFVGVGSPVRAGDLPAGTVSVSGTDPSSGGVIALDLAHPLVISGRLAPGSGAATGAQAGAGRVRLNFTIVGVPIASLGAPLGPPDPRGNFSASIDPGSARYLVAGLVTATLKITPPPGFSGGSRSFPVKSRQPVYLSVPGVAALALLLFVFAYAESLLRSLRRGRKRVRGTIGMAIIGAMTGSLAVVTAWLVGAREALPETLIACAVLGAGAGIAASMAALRIAKRRRRPRRA